MEYEGELTGKVALVTGAARNIGRDIALDLVRGGARVVLNAQTASPELEETAWEIGRMGGQSVSVVGDVTDPEDVEAMVQAAVENFGRLDILVNNASIRRNTPFLDLSFEEWQKVVSVALDGGFLCAKAAAPHIIAAGGGRIVNIGGVTAHKGVAGRAHVVAGKAGLVGLTKALAFDLAPHGITVNCVSPGVIETERGAAAGAEPVYHKDLPLVGRRGRPEEVAAMVRYLCGPHAGYITGQTIHVNGGMFMA